MPAGPIVYREDGAVDWSNMWDSFCVLAQEGGPPHREEMLLAPSNPDSTSDNYIFAVTEIARGIWEVAALTAVPATPGWLQILCQSKGQASWLAEAIEEENVQARHEGELLFVPVGDQFELKQEIKNVITAVAKTTHYWQEHLAVEVKQALAFQDKMIGIWHKIRRAL
jgi:sirohydrochlorin cobaltochelatase